MIDVGRLRIEYGCKKEGGVSEGSPDPVRAIMQPHNRDSCSDTDSGILADNASDAADHQKASDVHNVDIHPALRNLQTFYDASWPRLKKSDTCPDIQVGRSASPLKSSRQASPKARSGKSLRVRFADEVETEDSPPIPTRPSQPPCTLFPATQRPTVSAGSSAKFSNSNSRLRSSPVPPPKPQGYGVSGGSGSRALPTSKMGPTRVLQMPPDSHSQLRPMPLLSQPGIGPRTQTLPLPQTNGASSSFKPGLSTTAGHKNLPSYEAACQRIESLKKSYYYTTEGTSGPDACGISLSSNSGGTVSHVPAGGPSHAQKPNASAEGLYSSDYLRAKSNQLLLGTFSSANPGGGAGGTLPRNHTTSSSGAKNSCVMTSESCDAIVSVDDSKLSAPCIRATRPGRHRAGAEGGVMSTVRRRFASVERPRPRRGQSPLIAHNPGDDGRSTVEPCVVKCRLVGLDCQGVQTMELEKEHMDRPFGFFIAAGTFKKKKGIFVSRVSAQSLSPMLAVGDQILSVDNACTRALPLEQVQSLMANRTRITLKVLPSIVR